jgi:hypothetical protein
LEGGLVIAGRFRHGDVLIVAEHRFCVTLIQETLHALVQDIPIPPSAATPSAACPTAPTAAAFPAPSMAEPSAPPPA